ncbi:MAG TPA: NYN domain-containing protein [Abditibacteriaceae bacterium]|jgi:uncharacterized protein (TIGR00288 family)
MHAIQGTKIALLIDFDNVILGVDDPGFDVELVVNALRSRGVVVMGRAYGDWYRHHRHRRKLMEQGIELVETPVFGPVIKNSADIRIVLDGIDVATSHPHIDAFCLVSGDSDFLPLIKRLQLLGKSVIVIAGQKFTSELVRRNCNEYIAYENLLAESVGATEDVSSLEGAFKLLQRAMNTLNERGMDLRSSTVKQMMLQLNPAFSERTFACSQFKQFLDRAARAGIVKLGDRDGTSGEYAVILISDGDVQGAETKLTPTQRDSARGATSRQRGERFSSSRRRNEEPAPAEPVAEVSSDVSETVPAPASNAATTAEAIDDLHVAPIPSTPLSARSGLRRGRLRFSAKNGRSTVLPRNGTPAITSPEEVGSTPTDDATAQTATSQAPEAVQEDVVQAALADLPDTGSDAETVNVDAVTTDAAENATAADTTFASDIPAANEDSPAATVEDASAPATPKKRTSRGGRRRKPASAAGAASDAAPETGASTPEASDAGASDTNQAPVEATSADAAATDAAADTSSDAAETPAAEGDAAPAKKTSRGRRGGTRRATRPAKAAAPPAEDAS